MSTVYVVITGIYEDTGVSGVYDSPEAAMQAHPVPADYRYPETPSASNLSRRGGWQRNEHGEWNNGLDWQDAAYVVPYEVQSWKVER